MNAGSALATLRATALAGYGDFAELRALEGFDALTGGPDRSHAR